jgi:hypothetical protein
MKRLLAIGLTAFVAVGLFGGGVAAAHSSTATHHRDSHTVRAATFRVRASSAEQGERMSITVEARHAARGTAFSATAVVHFASGDVTVTLVRKGHSSTLRARVPVSATETVGPVNVDVTVTYGTTTTTSTVVGKVKPADTDEDDD